MTVIIKHMLSVALILLIPLAGVAQTPEAGTVRIIQDPAIDQLVSKHILINEVRGEVPGYRVQLFFDSGTHSKTKATGVCDEFRRKYPGIRVYLSFIAPNYKVRVGDFRTRLDAYRFLQGILPDYPNAYVVQDQITIQKNN